MFASKRTHISFETQNRHQEKSTTGISVAQQMRLMTSKKILKKEIQTQTLSIWSSLYWRMVVPLRWSHCMKAHTSIMINGKWFFFSRNHLDMNRNNLMTKNCSQNYSIQRSLHLKASANPFSWGNPPIDAMLNWALSKLTKKSIGCRNNVHWSTFYDFFYLWAILF